MTTIMKYFPNNTIKGVNFYKFPIILPNRKILTKIIIEGQEMDVQHSRHELYRLTKVFDIAKDNYYKYITMYDKEINVEYT